MKFPKNTWPKNRSIIKHHFRSKKHQARKAGSNFLDSVTQVIGACGRSQEWQSALHLFTEHLGVMPKSGEHALPRLKNRGSTVHVRKYMHLDILYLHKQLYIHIYIYICM